MFDVYWYEKNLQGDIVAVYNHAGTKLLTYTYDAWGNFYTTNIASSVPSVVTNNPFRYRRYYYDNDLSLYYLNSRYYDAGIGGFINPDSLMSGTNGSLHGFNLYAYCFNNPIQYVDHIGEFPWLIVIVGVTTSMVYTFIVSNILEGISSDSEPVSDSIYSNSTKNSEYDILYYDTDIYVLSDDVYNVAGEAGLYSTVGKVSENASINIDLAKASGSIGQFGASIGTYLAEVSMQQYYYIFGKKVTLSGGINYGLGASLSFGEKSVVGFTSGVGFIISLEVEDAIDN